MKICIFPNDPIKAYIEKGSIKTRYYNPENLFDEVHIISHTDNEVNVEKVQEVVGSAKLVFHTIGKMNLLNYKSKLNAVREIIKEVKPDMLRTYNPILQGWLATKVSKEFDIPLVLSLHTNYDKDYRRMFLESKKYIGYLRFWYTKKFIEPYDHNKSYSKDYDHLIDSGLYDQLVKSGLLIPHKEVDISPQGVEGDLYKTIQPEMIQFISYPYEWCFSQLKQAALATLEIQTIAMTHEMTLKDASAYNIQFKENRPLLIDTLSFERIQKGKPWQAYRQFCQHFLAPLALMCHKDIRLNQLFRVYLDGIPLDLASKLLPVKTRTMFSLLTHIHAHAKSQKHYADKQDGIKKRQLSRRSFEGIIASLRSGVSKLKWSHTDTEWGKYYSDTNYSEKALLHKKELVSTYITKIKPCTLWDLGANTGMFSRLASKQGISSVAFDSDPVAVEKNYLDCIKDNEQNLYPCLLDLTNPSSSLGWDNRERTSFIKRGPVDMVLALALIHHLAISNNLPFERIAGFFQKLCKFLIIEFVPKNDSQVQRLLATRKDIFDNYTKESFESAFGKYFKNIESVQVEDSQRSIYSMESRS